MKRPKAKDSDGTTSTTESGYTLAIKELVNSYVVNTSTNKRGHRYKISHL